MSDHHYPAPNPRQGDNWGTNQAGDGHARSLWSQRGSIKGGNSFDTVSIGGADAQVYSLDRDVYRLSESSVPITESRCEGGLLELGAAFKSVSV